MKEKTPKEREREKLAAEPSEVQNSSDGHDEGPPRKKVMVKRISMMI